MAMLLTLLAVTLMVLPPSLGAAQPGCNFSNNQCVYNVKLGHEGQCDTSGSVGGAADQPVSCCQTVQSNMNSLHGVVDILTMQLQQVQSHLGLTQSTGNLHNNTDTLIQELRQKEAELNSSQSNLADLVKRSADVIKELKEELASATSNLNNCKGVLGMKTNNNVAETAPEYYTQTLCTFEDGFCGYIVGSGDGHWVQGSGSQNTLTGPREDHTYGSPKGRYMILDPRSRYKNGPKNRTLLLTSAEFKPAQRYCIRFWYNMYGADIRSLRVYGQTANGYQFPIWRNYGNQGKTWHLAEKSLATEYTDFPFRIVFEGMTNAYFSPDRNISSNDMDDIAIDDVYVYNISCSSIQSCPERAIIRKGQNSTTCYSFHTTPKNWYDSAKACREDGPNSHLVSINSRDEQQFLVSRIKQNAGLKVAGNSGWFTSGNDERSEGTFDWTDTGTPYTSQYTDWYFDQPNNIARDQNCLLMQYADSGYEWGDVDCDGLHPFICEVNLPTV